LTAIVCFILRQIGIFLNLPATIGERTIIMNEIINDYIIGEKNLEEANDALASIGAGVKLDPKRNTIKPGEEADFGLPHSFFQGGIYHESSLETLVKSCRYPGCQNRCPDCRRCRAGRCELARDRLRLCAGRSAVLADLCRGASRVGRWQQLKIS
jgi:hypothetical protein